MGGARLWLYHTPRSAKVVVHEEAGLSSLLAESPCFHLLEPTGMVVHQRSQEWPDAASVAEPQENSVTSPSMPTTSPPWMFQTVYRSEGIGCGREH